MDEQRSLWKNSSGRRKFMVCEKGVWPLGRSISTLSGHAGMQQGRQGRSRTTTRASLGM